ncbi:hypothetical protein EDD15DRAFT_2197057 [Pisolithus albus]|nr:hypothetical protein EDD15DRAFT_2197057 [Pisolithus albus]
MSTTAATVSVDLSLSWGSMLAGIFASLILYGISILQTFIYYVQYPKDRTSLKLLVVGLLLLDTLHQFLACAGILWGFYQPHDDAPAFIVGHSSYLSMGNLKWIIPLILMPFVVAQPVLSISLTNHRFQKLANASNGTAAAVDITIAAALCTLLAMGRSGEETEI